MNLKFSNLFCLDIMIGSPESTMRLEHANKIKLHRYSYTYKY